MPRRRNALLPAAAAAALAILLGSCASEPEPTPAEQSASATEQAAAIEPAAVDDALAVQVTGDVNPDVAPQVSITTPLSVEETTRKVVAAGDGAEIGAEDEVRFAYSLWAGSTGAELDSSYGRTDARFELAQITRGIARGLVGGHVGDRLAIAIAPDDGFGEAVTQFQAEGVDAQTTLVLVADVVDARSPDREVPTAAEGEPVTPPADLPAVTLDAEGLPTGVTVPQPAPAPPAETVAQPLLRGSGRVVEVGDEVTIHYVGATYNDGQVFESSRTNGQPFTTSIGTGQVIPGWDAGIPGQTVGSRVLLVIPAAQAYGDAPSGGQPAGPLVFVVDILEAF